MTKSLFQEYLNSRSKMQAPVVDPSGDQLDPKTPPVKPPHGGKPYAVSNGKTKKGKEKGFGELGDQDLKFTFKNNSKEVKAAKIPTVEQVELSVAVAEAIQKDPSLLENLVRQIKSHGYLGALVAEVFDHQDTFTHLAEIMSHKTYGPDFCENIVESLSEEVAPAFADELDAEDEEEDEDEEEGEEDEDEEGLEDLEGEMPVDPNAMDGQMMNQDPMAGLDPNAMGQAGVPPMMPQPIPGQMMPPMQGQMPQGLMNFQKAFQRAFQRKMMVKK